MWSSAYSTTTPTLRTHLGRFLFLLLRLAPPRLWWALAGVLFAVLNLVFRDEVWPNTPQMKVICWLLILLCCLVGMWAAVATIKQLHATLTNFLWRAVWYGAWLLANVAAVLVTGVAVVAAFFWLCLLF